MKPSYKMLSSCNLDDDSCLVTITVDGIEHEITTTNDTAFLMFDVIDRAYASGVSAGSTHVIGTIGRVMREIEQTV